MKNFQKAGELLCELWGNTVIDGHSAECIYRKPIATPMKIDPLTAEWVENHCSISKYYLQIAKCEDRRSCKKPRCDTSKIIPEKFLKDPLLIKRSKGSGITLADMGKEEPLKGKRVYTSLTVRHLTPVGYEEVDLPYDLYCTSIQKKF